MLGRGSTCSFRLCWAVLLACYLWGPGDALVTAPLPSRVARPVARRLATCRSEFEGMRQGARRISRRAALQGLAAAPALLSGARRSQAEEEEGDAATSSVVFIPIALAPSRCCTFRALKRSRLLSADQRDCGQGQRDWSLQGPFWPVLRRGEGLATSPPVCSMEIAYWWKALRLTGSGQVVPPEEGDDAAAAAAIREGINPKKRAIYLQQSMQPSFCTCSACHPSRTIVASRPAYSCCVWQCG